MSVVFEHKTHVDNSLEDAFAWHERKAFRRLMPPWELAEEVRADDNLEEGSQRIFRFPMGPIKMSWVAQHTAYNPPHSFEDIMLKGPFKSWHHTHKFEKTSDGKVLIHDKVNYKLPLGFSQEYCRWKNDQKTVNKNVYSQGNKTRTRLKATR